LILFYLGGLDVTNKIEIHELAPGIANPLLALDPTNQFKYSNGATREDMVIQLNAKNPERNLKIPESMKLRYIYSCYFTYIYLNINIHFLMQICGICWTRYESK